MFHDTLVPCAERRNISMKILKRIFIDGLSGMAIGLFATLIIGTILEQIGTFVGGDIGHMIVMAASIAKVLTGAGIGIGVACKLGEETLVCASAASAGMIGAFATGLLDGSVITNGKITLSGPGEPLGAFVAAYIGIELGRIFVGRTKLDIILTPFITILGGGVVGLTVGPYISDLMKQIGEMIRWGTEQQPFLMGIIVSVLMGMALTLPISSAALGVILNLSGIAAGAATVGCCAQMIGFATSSFRENGIGGLLAQGIGTSMLQVPNIVRKPLIWLPTIITSAILGPISTVVLKMTKAEETTKSGIILSEGSKEKPQIAEVIAVGPGGNVDGKEIKMYVKTGDKVVITKYAGTEIKYEGEDYIIVKQNDILAIAE